MTPNFEKIKKINDYKYKNYHELFTVLSTVGITLI